MIEIQAPAPNGVDDTDALNKLIADAPDEPVTIMFQPGTYRLTGQLKMAGKQIAMHGQNLASIVYKMTTEASPIL